MDKQSGKYYVYELADPRDGKVFYVGKGTSYRINCHERQAAKGVSSHKCNKIRQINKLGLSIIKNKVAFFESERDAYLYEMELINFYGLENLTNVRVGGAGGANVIKNQKPEISPLRLKVAFNIILIPFKYKSMHKELTPDQALSVLKKNKNVFSEILKKSEFGKYGVTAAFKKTREDGYLAICRSAYIVIAQNAIGLWERACSDTECKREAMEAFC